MKQILIYFLFACSTCCQLKAQSFRCGYVASTQTVSARPVTCTGMSGVNYTSTVNFLDDLVPQASEQTLTVNVNFYLFSPTVGVGYWDAANTGDADYVLYVINRKYDSLWPSHISIPGVPASPVSTKIYFAKKSFQIVDDQQTYDDPATAMGNPLYDDTTAINVYYGACPSLTSCTAYVPTPVPNNHVVYNSSATQTFAACGNALTHEFGHVLGLEHTAFFTAAAFDGHSFVTLKQGCCPLVVASDSELSSAAEFTTICNCGPVGSPCTSNIMSYNYFCQRSFSPRQIAAMHYNLRTSLLNLLTPASYTYAVSRNATFDYTVSSNETWVNDRYMKGNVLVKAGAKLTVGCLVAMTQNSKIVVEPGAVLSVYGGTITNISGQHWDGIQVQGSPTADQSINTGSGFAYNQGLLSLDFLAELSNAGTAAMNYVTNSSNTVVWSSIGGIIQAYNSNFINNSRDVEFLSYPYYPSASWFRLCNFKTTAQLNNSLSPFAHATLWDVYGVNFLGCNFEYAAGSTYSDYSRGFGIFSLDANYTINEYCENSIYASYPCPTMAPSTFKKMTRGIWAVNSIPQRAMMVTHTSFYDHIWDAIYCQNLWNFGIDQNYIRTADGGANGIYLNSCKNYVVKNNTLEETGGGNVTTGMYAYNSGEGYHQVYRNNFSGFNAALIAEDNNSGYNNNTDGLKMNCNDFTAVANQWDIAVIGNGTGLNAPTVMRKQGAITGIVTSTMVVRNQYAASCGAENKWAVAGDGTNTLVIAHGTNTNAVCQPTPQPSCSNTVVNVISFPIQFDYTAHCVPYPASSGGGPISNSDPETLSNINSYYGALVAQGEDADTYELGATMTSRLNYFQVDTTAGAKDSIISTLTANYGHMANADVQLVFAYLNKGDYETAATLADALGSTRGDWKTLLQTLIAMYQEPNKIYSLTSSSNGYYDVLADYAADPYRDGCGIAQALLRFVSGTPYSEPRLLPGSGDDSRLAQAATAAPLITDAIKVYPNPAQKNVTVSYISKAEGQALIELKDLLGNTIYTNFIMSGSEQTVPLANYSNGVYLLTVTRNKVLIYKTKLVKQD